MVRIVKDKKNLNHGGHREKTGEKSILIGLRSADWQGLMCHEPTFRITSVKLIFAINCQSSSQLKRAANDL